VQKNLRTEDLFGRIGGEEFVLLLPRISAEQAAQIAERLRTQFAQHSFTLANGQSLHVSFSAGLRFVPADEAEQTLDTLLSQADAALYQAKANGRNCILFYTPAATHA
jgi:diguanylate cyclase